MNKLVGSILLSGIFFSGTGYYGSSTAPVVIAGGIIKAKHVDPVQKKYKRKDCPVCKGKGWYISGDKIKKVECGYCEPDNEQKSSSPEIICDDNSCKTKVIRR